MLRAGASRIGTSSGVAIVTPASIDLASAPAAAARYGIDFVKIFSFFSEQTIHLLIACTRCCRRRVSVPGQTFTIRFLTNYNISSLRS
jgi:hypothetical protein